MQITTFNPVMKDLNGFYVDVSQPDVPLERDAATIRMNVDNFEEAYHWNIQAKLYNENFPLATWW